MSDTGPLSFQDLILTLHDYWGQQGCAILQPYDMEMGAGTFHPATTLRALGPDPGTPRYVQPCRRPTDGRYGENPNRLGALLPISGDPETKPARICRSCIWARSTAIGIDPLHHDIRFVEDDWESPTLGAWGLGWEVWCDGMEVTQFTYFQQMGGFDCKPVAGELTYGLERLAMYIQNMDSIFDLAYNNATADRPAITYGDVFRENEQADERLSFRGRRHRHAVRWFKKATARGRALSRARTLPVPAYEQAIKASHFFNVLQARGVISVQERASYMGRVVISPKAAVRRGWTRTGGRRE